jgi:formylglycine-generating enzyme required for sulfatase activity
MKWVRVPMVILGAVIVTALGIDAADTLQGARSTLFGQVIQHTESGCPAGMVSVPNSLSFTCVDVFEAAAGPDCIHSRPQNIQQTMDNLQDTDCVPHSAPDAMPWRFLTRDQAQTACLSAGKRLPTNEEWYVLALGTIDDSSCNTDSTEPYIASVDSDCVSKTGVYDAVGNVWEWTSDDAVAGAIHGRVLPTEGYVTAVDKAGVAVETTAVPNTLYNEDYFWSSTDSVRAVMRGGFYGSGSDAGLYATHADVATDFSGAGIGFRCVK